MNLREILNRELLPTVQRPSRYVGTEFNSVHKPPEEVELRVALAFPDLYDLGLGNLGLHILYTILNDLPWCWAERTYAPAPDMEAALRERGLPLYAYESKDALSDLDLVGFTLQSELTYTSVLNMIDLSGLPLRASGRADAHPIICAGGPGALNPEPLAPFIDCFIIGDGEEAIVEVATVLRSLRGARREKRLDALAAVPGVYVPALYPVETLPDGRVLPRADAPKIIRRVVRDLDRAPFPADLVVPFTQQVHDRAGIEVFRGCTRGCGFCQAGMVGRPVRERSVDCIDQILEQALERTGYEEVSLVSLSTCDYSGVGELLARVVERAAPSDTAVSLPSLRLDGFSVALADMVAGVRRSGLTFAPEAATPRLRAVINKWITDDDVLAVTSEAFRLGWNHVKCYFMIGLPTESDEDVRAIVELCRRTLEDGRKVNRKAQVFTGISTFVPKPFTPFQWCAQIDHEETLRRQAILSEGFRRCAGIKYGRHAAESSFIEGLIARGDRRAAALIEAAFERGARLDTSSEYFNFPAWLDAIEVVDYNVSQALGERAPDERLPWDHIDILVPKSWFFDERKRALGGGRAGDCRVSGCNRCGIIEREPGLCATMLARAEQARKQKPEPSGARDAREEPPPAQRLRFRVGRNGEARFLSHLEWMTAWTRALRRAKAPVAHSQGYHAHPKVTFSTALPVGEASEGEYMDVVLRERVEPQALLMRLQDTLPSGFMASAVAEVPLGTPSLMSAVVGFAYTIEVEDGDAAALSEAAEQLIAADTLTCERKTRPRGRKKGPSVKVVDLRPSVRTLTVRPRQGVGAVIDVLVVLVGGIVAKPAELIRLLEIHRSKVLVTKRDTLLAESKPPS